MKLFCFVCKLCGKHNEKSFRKNQIPQFCNQTCSNTFNLQSRIKGSAKQRMKFCRLCTKEFVGRTNSLYCSVLCKKDMRKNRRVGYSSQIYRRYGLSLKQYDVLVEQQNGVCAICKRSDVVRAGSNRLFVDHCHKFGHVRGLLCYKCNTILGHAGDNATILRRAAVYLEEHSMPVYQFRCLKCKKEIEIQCKITESQQPLCCEEGCDGIEMERIISSTGFILKGSSWARDGYK